MEGNKDKEKETDHLYYAYHQHQNHPYHRLEEEDAINEIENEFVENEVGVEDVEVQVESTKDSYQFQTPGCGISGIGIRSIRRRPKSVSSSTSTTTNTSGSVVSSIKRVKQATLDVFRKCISISTSDLESNEGYNSKDQAEISPISSQQNVAVNAAIEIELKDNDVNEQSSTDQATDGLIAILDGKFFAIIRKKSAAKCNSILVEARCQACKVIISGSKDSSSNFLRHLRKFHKGDLLAYEKYKKEKSLKILKKKNHENGLGLMTNYMATKTGSLNLKIKTQKEFDVRIINFFSHNLYPFSMLDDEEFKALFNFNLMSRRTMVRRIQEAAYNLKNEIISETEKVNYVSIATDVWKCSKKAFLGVTLHFIDDNMKRKNYMLKCTRMKGTIDYIKIASILQDILADYNISEKTVTCVTDNGSNFIKCFKEFGITDVDSLIVKDDEDGDGYVEENLIFVDILSDSGYNFLINEYALPLHLKCGSHTISLVATTDYKKILSNDEQLNRIHESAISKCNILFHATHNPKSFEVIVDATGGKSINYPTAVRWNSLYDSLRDVMSFNEKILNAIFKGLNKFDKRLLPADIAYIQFYLHLMKPFAEAIDILQGENNMFYGIFLPVIHRIYEKITEEIDALSTDKSSFATIKRNTMKSMRDSFEKRYHKELRLNTEDLNIANVRFGVLAAISHPTYRLQWFHSHSKKRELQAVAQSLLEEEVKKLLLNETNERQQKQTELSNHNQINEKEINTTHTFFNNLSNATESENNDSQISSLEVLMFLQAKQLTILNLQEGFPHIKEIFLRYNTPLPSSASVERLFSYATIIRKTRFNISDENFENCIFLKYNNRKIK